jgi:uncharacterized membrane protein
MSRAFLLLLPLVLIAVSIPLVMQRVPPNAIYGFRTQKTMSDARIWYEANRRAGLNLIGGACVALGLGELLFWWLGEARANVVFPLALLLVVLGSVAVSLLQLRRM